MVGVRPPQLVPCRAVALIMPLPMQDPKVPGERSSLWHQLGDLAMPSGSPCPRQVHEVQGGCSPQAMEPASRAGMGGEGPRGPSLPEQLGFRVPLAQAGPPCPPPGASYCPAPGEPAETRAGPGGAGRWCLCAAGSVRPGHRSVPPAAARRQRRGGVRAAWDQQRRAAGRGVPVHLPRWALRGPRRRRDLS